MTPPPRRHIFRSARLARWRFLTALYLRAARERAAAGASLDRIQFAESFVGFSNRRRARARLLIGSRCRLRLSLLFKPCAFFESESRSNCRRRYAHARSRMLFPIFTYGRLSHLFLVSAAPNKRPTTGWTADESLDAALRPALTLDGYSCRRPAIVFL